MVKVIGPCFGLDARGTLGKSLTYSIRKGVNYIRNYVVPRNPKTAAQLQNRGAFEDGVSKWRWEVIPTYQKTDWASYSAGTTESGFNRFMRYYLKANYNKTTKTKVVNQFIPSPQ